MPAVARIDPKEVFTPREWARLSARSPWKGLALVACAWGLILAAGALFALWPNPLTYVLAVMLVGARQLGLAILMHDAAHGALHANQKLNDWVGEWLCAAPVGGRLESYRAYGVTHAALALHRQGDTPCAIRGLRADLGHRRAVLGNDNGFASLGGGNHAGGVLVGLADAHFTRGTLYVRRCNIARFMGSCDVIADIPSFIRDNTRVLAPSRVPELALHLADDAVALWELTEEQLGALGLPPPFWAFAWAGGQALARYLLDHPEIVRGRNVLDLASGSGLVAIAAMKAGAASALAADIDPFAADAARLNATLNGVAVKVTQDDLIGVNVDADVILVGDLFYDRDIAAPLLAWLIDMTRAGKGVLIGDPGRTYLPKDKLEQITAYNIPVTRALEDAEIKRAAVWRLL
jgi:predicted nicotinamide N-methyase